MSEVIVSEPEINCHELQPAAYCRQRTLPSAPTAKTSISPAAPEAIAGPHMNARPPTPGAQRATVPAVPPVPAVPASRRAGRRAAAAAGARAARACAAGGPRGATAAPARRRAGGAGSTTTTHRRARGAASAATARRRTTSSCPAGRRTARARRTARHAAGASVPAVSRPSLPHRSPCRPSPPRRFARRSHRRRFRASRQRLCLPCRRSQVHLRSQDRTRTNRIDRSDPRCTFGCRNTRSALAPWRTSARRRPSHRNRRRPERRSPPPRRPTTIEGEVSSSSA